MQMTTSNYHNRSMVLFYFSQWNKLYKQLRNNNFGAGTTLIFETFFPHSLSTVSQSIDSTLCGSYILQFFFLCDLIVHPSRLLFWSWLEKQFDILFKYFNRHPEWSQRKSYNHKHDVRSATRIKPTCNCMSCHHSLTQNYFIHLGIIKISWWLMYI